ncbi:MAG: hypothetical protein IIC74_05830 [Bacteroidetes bacterium]|nr:hypothetical protein [Bacteroidota bacterium]
MNGEKEKKFTIIHIYILFGITLVFGYLIYQQLSAKAPAADQHATSSGSTSAEQGVLIFAGEDASGEERRLHAELVRKEAKDVNILDISNCAPNPIALAVGYGESITIKNSDTVSHTLSHRIDREASVIPAGGTKDIVVSDFVGIEEGKEGFAGYLCDGSPAGIFHIIAS